MADDTKPTEPTEDRPRQGCEQPPSLDAEDEAALDRAWERIRRREEKRKRLSEKFGWGPGCVAIIPREKPGGPI